MKKQSRMQKLLKDNIVVKYEDGRTNIYFRFEPIYQALLDEVIGEDEDDLKVITSTYFNETEALKAMIIRNNNQLRAELRQKWAEFCGVSDIPQSDTGIKDRISGGRDKNEN